MDETERKRRPIHIAFMSSRLFVVASALATLLTFIGFALTFEPVKRIVYGRDVSLQWEVLSEVPVFDIRRPLPELRVIYKGADLTRSNRAIVVSSIQIINNGNEPIGPSRLTNIDPLGFQVSGGVLTQVLSSTGSSDHLRRHLRATQLGDKVYLGTGWIMDPGDWIRVSVLVQKEPNASVSYQVIGKVGGINKSTFSQKSAVYEDGFLNEAFAGGPLIHLVRLLAYFIIGTFVFVTVLIGSLSVSDWAIERRRQKRELLANEILDTDDDKHGQVTRFIRLAYISLGLRGLIRLRTIISRPDSAREEYLKLLKSRYSNRFKREEGEEALRYISRRLSPRTALPGFVLAMENLGFFSFEKATTSVDFEELLNRTIEELSAPNLSRRAQRSEPKGTEARLSLAAPPDRFIEHQGPGGERIVLEIGSPGSIN